MNIIKLQVLFEWSLEWDCRGQISLPTGMGGKLKKPSSCTVNTAVIRVNIIKLQVMFEWSLEWDCRGQISLPTGMGGKLKTTSSCTVNAAVILKYQM